MRIVYKGFCMGLLWAGLAFCQNPNTAVFPGVVADDEDLLVQSNQATTTLNGTINASTLTITLTNATNFLFPGIITIESERIKVCSKSTNTLTVCSGGRGFDGSTAASHTSGVAVSGYLTRYEHNQMAAEMKAVQAAVLAIGTADFYPSVLGSTLSVAAGRARIGNYAPVSIAAGTATFTVGTGNVKVFIDTNNNLVCHMQTGVSATNTGGLVCSNVASPSYPANSIPIANVTVTSTVPEITSDDRAFLTNRGVSAGTGISITDSGGVASIGIDTATVPQLGAGSNDFTGSATFLDLQLLNSSEPTCNSTTRGKIVMVQGGAGVADTARLCSKDAAGAYAWRTIL